MTLTEFFWAIGDFFDLTFTLLQNDLGLTAILNYGILALGFVGLFYWLNWQRKFNERAAKNPTQLK